MAERTIEGVLRRLHVFKKVRVVDDAGHVRLRQLDAALDLVFVGHGKIYDWRLAIGDLKFVVDSNAANTSRAMRASLKCSRTTFRPASPSARARVGFSSNSSTASASAVAFGSAIKSPPVFSTISGNAAWRGCTTGTPAASASIT